MDKQFKKIKGMPLIAFRSLVFGFSGLFYFLFIYYGETSQFPGLDVWELYTLSTAGAILIGHLLFWINKKIDLRFSWEKNTRQRLLIGLFFHSVFSAFLAIGFGYLVLQFYQALENSMFLFAQQGQNVLLKLGVLLFISGVFFTILQFSISAYNHYNTNKINAIKSRREHLLLQFEALKTQLSPHYLFNCLNTISSLAFKDSALAEAFIRKLWLSYEYLLSSDQHLLVTLEEELKFVNDYIFLQNIRFDNSIQVKIVIPENQYKHQVPPLALQILIENAIKHNVFSEETPLRIDIRHNQKNGLEITNNKNIKTQTETSFAIGINNIKNRYKFFTDQQVLVLNKEEFKVKIPLLNPNFTVPVWEKEGVYA